MIARVTVLQGAKNQQLMVRLPTTIGRSSHAELKLPASTVSRRHCEIYEYDGAIAIRDLESANGTLVNGHRISAPTFVSPDDDVTIGPVTVRLQPLAKRSAPDDTASVGGSAVGELANEPDPLLEYSEANIDQQGSFLEVLQPDASGAENDGAAEHAGRDGESGDDETATTEAAPETANSDMADDGPEAAVPRPNLFASESESTAGEQPDEASLNSFFERLNSDER